MFSFRITDFTFYVSPSSLNSFAACTVEILEIGIEMSG